MVVTKLANVPESVIKPLPANIEAEQVILGGILNNNEVLNQIGDFLFADDFFEPVHNRIFNAILRLNNRGLLATPITLKSEFDKDEALKALGGANYLVRMMGLASGVFNIRDYASIVHSLGVSRKLINIGQEIVSESYSENGEKRGSEQIELYEQKLFNLASEGSSDTNYKPVSQSIASTISAVELAVKNGGIISGLPSQFLDMDRLLGGFHNSDLIIIAARPSMGKTALALNIAMNVAEHFKKEYEGKKQANKLKDDEKLPSVGVVSLEMSSEQLATRLLSLKTGINASNIRRGRLDNFKENNEIEQLIRASQEINSLPIYLDDTPALSISAIRTRARRLKRKHNLSFLVIDYLQLIRGVLAQGKDNRVQEISEISMNLKAIAKELNIPVIALSQLSRSVEQRPDKRPQLSDLRESGSIEQDADMVMFIYREAYYEERKKPSESDIDALKAWQQKMDEIDNVAEILISKNRNGPIGNITLFFDKNTTKFNNYEERR